MTVPARWMVVSVRPPPGVGPDEVASALLDLGGRAVVEEQDRLATHLPEPADPQAVMDRLRDALAGPAGPAVGGGEEALDVRIGWQEHQDWARVWRRGLAPRRITERLVVTPSWMAPGTSVPPSGDPPEPDEVAAREFPFRDDDLVIVLDPGIAFGTAEHGTTRGCLRLLDGAVRPGDRVLDVGAGSGILAIAAARLGAAEVLAVEGDAWAAEVARTNVEANGVADRVDVWVRWADAAWLAGRAPGDGATANIETGVLRDLLPGLRDALRSGGWLILSGVPADEWRDLAGDVEGAGFAHLSTDADGEWRSGLFRRR